MEIEVATRTVLERSPGLKAKDLLRKVEKRTGKSRSTIFDEWHSLELRGKLYRNKGEYWNEKPTASQQKRGMLGAASDFLNRRLKRKLLEEKEEKKRDDLEMKRCNCRIQIRRMIREYYRTCPYEKRNEPVPMDVQADIERECRRQFGLPTTDPL